MLQVKKEKKIIMDMYKFQAKPHELKGVDYFLENPYVYDNYKYILNDIKDYREIVSCLE